MTNHQFKVLVSDRVDLWNRRMPRCLVGYIFTRHGVDLYDHSVLRPDPFIRDFNYDPAFERLSLDNPSDCFMILTCLINILEKYFGHKEVIKEDAKMPTKNETHMNNLVITTASGTSSINVDVSNLYGSEVSSYFVDDILTTYDACERISFNYLSGYAWKRWLHKIDRVIFNDPATIILWKSGEKTVVKCGPNETFDKEKGLAMALCKYILGNKGNFNQFFKALMKEDK